MTFPATVDTFTDATTFSSTALGSSSPTHTAFHKSETDAIVNVENFVILDHITFLACFR